MTVNIACCSGEDVVFFQFFHTESYVTIAKRENRNPARAPRTVFSRVPLMYYFGRRLPVTVTTEDFTRFPHARVGSLSTVWVSRPKAAPSPSAGRAFATRAGDGRGGHDARRAGVHFLSRTRAPDT